MAREQALDRATRERIAQTAQSLASQFGGLDRPGVAQSAGAFAGGAFAEQAGQLAELESAEAQEAARFNLEADLARRGQLGQLVSEALSRTGATDAQSAALIGQLLQFELGQGQLALSRRESDNAFVVAMRRLGIDERAAAAAIQQANGDARLAAQRLRLDQETAEREFQLALMEQGRASAPLAPFDRLGRAVGLEIGNPFVGVGEPGPFGF